MYLDNSPGRTARIDGKEFLFFSGYAYLGMHQLPAFNKLLMEGIEKFGPLFPSSRISNTQLSLFNEFEAMVAGIAGFDETVCFSSGFLAGRAVLELMEGKEMHVAPGTHPAISRESSAPGSFKEWTEDIAHKPKPGSVLFFDSVNPLKAERNDLEFLERLPQGIHCVIDDSHGAGLLNKGRGIGPSLPAGRDYILTFSLSKACQLTGGVVSCSKEVAKKLRASAFYTASTSMPPAFAWAFIHGQELYQQQRERLAKNMNLFRKLTADHFKNTDEFPVFMLPAGMDEAALLSKGIIISSFAYPNASGPRVNRIVINAGHTADDLICLAESLLGLHQV